MSNINSKDQPVGVQIDRDEFVWPRDQASVSQASGATVWENGSGTGPFINIATVCFTLEL